LSFKLTLSAHPNVLNVLSVNFTIIRIYKVMLHSRPTQNINIHIYLASLPCQINIYKLIWDAIVEDYRYILAIVCIRLFDRFTRSAVFNW